ALLREGIVTYCLAQHLSDVNLLLSCLPTNGFMTYTLLQFKVGLVTYYLRLYPGDVTLPRPQIK
uniref:Uncharacterized protein n=1 Tax=Gorilla gorilla gorilla TaxID=9595 RepID=G3RRU4_GORGO